MAATFGGAATPGGATAVTSLNAGSLTPSGSNLVGVVVVSQYRSPDLAPTATWGATSMGTAVATSSTAEAPGTRRVTVFVLTGIPASAQTPQAQWSSAVGEAVVNAFWVSGVDQTTPAGAVITNANGGAATLALNTILCAVGDLVMAAISADAGPTATITGSGTIQGDALAAANTSEGAVQTTPGAGTSVNLTFSNIVGGSGGTSVGVGFALKDGGAGGGPAPHPLYRKQTAFGLF